MRRTLGVSVLVGCSGSAHPHIPDASVSDAEVASVFETACSLSAPIVSTTDNVFAFAPPSTAIAQDGVIKFTMSPTHGVASAPGDVVMAFDKWDLGLVVGIGDTTCLRFTQPGTFRFHDPAYNFRGAVTVQ